MEKYTLGIDSGSTTTKGVLFNGKDIVKSFIIKTGAKPKESIYKVYNELYDENVVAVVTTGYGRELLEERDKSYTEITCHAKGALYLNPKIRGVIDIGGQDSKVIEIDRFQNVSDFLMNDKCAAGTGRFMQVMMRILEEDIENIDQFIIGKEPVNITSMCTVFAESEVISLLAKDVDRGDIALGIINSICKRTGNFSKKVNIEGEIFFSGGLSKFEIFRKKLEEETGKKIVIDVMSQFAGAIGAAVIAWNKINR